MDAERIMELEDLQHTIACEALEIACEREDDDKVYALSMIIEFLETSNESRGLGMLSRLNDSDAKLIRDTLAEVNKKALRIARITDAPSEVVRDLDCLYTLCTDASASL